MENAIATTIAAQHAAARAIKPGVEENWVAGLIDLEFKRGGAVRPGFEDIVGSGHNSTVLHYPEHSATIQAGGLVVVDIGSDYGHYSADITRTYPADGAFTQQQRAIYDVVLRAQEACIEMVRPGVFFEDIQRRAEEIIRSAGYRDYFPHGIGHFVGLDVHDSGLYSKPLAAGMIAEATAEARKAAEQFAKDSKSRLGGIHRANQGVFVILPRDASDSGGGPGMGEQSQMFKLVRVVTTVEYLLRG